MEEAVAQPHFEETLDDGWPESVEKHVTLVLCYYKENARSTHKICCKLKMYRSWSNDEQTGDNRDDMLDSKRMKAKQKMQETDSDKQKQA